MAKVKDFYGYLNSIAPFETQEDWDNSGMLVGDMNAEVKKVAVVLDITHEEIKKAKAIGADLIISHHPVIFNPIKSVTKGSVPYELVASSINALCCHTPLDIADGGTNDSLAELLGIEVTRTENPILRLGTVEPTTAENLAGKIAKTLNTKVRYADAGRKIEKIAICTGAGCSLIEAAGEIDAFITGDASHHNFLDCVQAGITLIAAGHYETEIVVVPVLVKKLQAQFPDIEIIDIKQENPIKFI
ncbi:MAG TPA: Nif3-like dinuclear metal center hexameric protein [Ruminococcaceae bacterium]|jgi:dinuclear metal center YbgI/SA1388 family protein|nr:Nif3-like dinuclear metal center hexameric protein [Oscillospiraceae bacterium]